MPPAIEEFDVDALNFVGSTEEASQIHADYVTPFLALYPHYLTPAERTTRSPIKGRPRTVLVTKTAFSTSVEVTIGNFARIVDPREFNFGFVAEHDLDAVSAEHFNTLVLYRSLSGRATELLRAAQKSQKPVLYFIDDNMFKFGTGYLADEHAYLTPGMPGHAELCEQVRLADLVVTYSASLTDECRARNPRVVQLSTNILASYIERSEAPVIMHGDRVKFALLSGGARKRELARLWPAIAAFAACHADAVEFHFWGMDPAPFGRLACPCHFRPFENVLHGYLDALGRERFHYVLCPLDDDHETKRAKSPVKYLEITAAGAVGLYSDVPSYEEVKDGITGLKVRDDGWTSALEGAFGLDDASRLRMHASARADVLARFTTETQVLQFLAMFEAAELHGALRSDPQQSGQPVIGFFFHETALGGATLHLLKHAEILGKFGFRPWLFVPEATPAPEFMDVVTELGFGLDAGVALFATVSPRPVSADDRIRAQEIRRLLIERSVALVHTTTYLADAALAAMALDLPLVRTLHQFHEAAEGPAPVRLPDSRDTEPARAEIGGVVHSSSLRYANAWSRALNVPAYCMRAPISSAHFSAFGTRRAREPTTRPNFIVSGTLQPRKGQLEAILAVARLVGGGNAVRLTCMGYDHYFPAYKAECAAAIHAHRLQDLVSFPGFVTRTIEHYANADFVLCASDDESLPQSILKAMAMGIPVVSTDVGGVAEVLIDGYSAVLARDNSPAALAEAMERAIALDQAEWATMLERAHETARMLCSEDVVGLGLLRIYNEAARRRRNPR